MTIQERAIKIAELVKEHYPSPKTELIHENEMQLAVSVMLSAQTTDKKVNQITRTLFPKYPSWDHFAQADLSQLQQDIRGVNFHLGKADRLIKAARMVLSEYSGCLPKAIPELTRIPGIARKTANVILNEVWDISEGVVVDTHISRVSNRLGLTTNTDPVKIERDLMTLLPKNCWRTYSGGVVLHGRYVCTARKPKCSECFLNEVCPSAFKVD